MRQLCMDAILVDSFLRPRGKSFDLRMHTMKSDRAFNAKKGKSVGDMLNACKWGLVPHMPERTIVLHLALIFS